VGKKIFILPQIHGFIDPKKSSPQTFPPREVEAQKYENIKIFVYTTNPHGFIDPPTKNSSPQTLPPREAQAPNMGGGHVHFSLITQTVMTIRHFIQEPF